MLLNRPDAEHPASRTNPNSAGAKFASFRASALGWIAAPLSNARSKFASRIRSPCTMSEPIASPIMVSNRSLLALWLRRTSRRSFASAASRSPTRFDVCVHPKEVRRVVPVFEPGEAFEPFAVCRFDALVALVGDEVGVDARAVWTRPFPAFADPRLVALSAGVGGGPCGGEAYIEADFALADRRGVGVDPADRAAHGPAVDLREGRRYRGDAVQEYVDNVVGEAREPV